MRGHQTYSLNTILNTNQIQPYLYQQILHDIKSPLEQLSIDITNDNSIDIQKVPKRPNIPPPPKSPLNQLAEFNFSRTHQSYQMDLKESATKKKQNFHDEIIQSVLSPLDHQISFKEQPKQQPFFCGGLMQSILKSENSFEIQLPARTKISKRRPIFESSKYSKTATKIQKPIDEVIMILYELGQIQMAMFFQLLRDLQIQLGNIMLQKQGIKNYLQIIYDRLSDNIQFVDQEKDSPSETYRILRRLRSKNTYELITKIVKEHSKQKNTQADRKLQKLLDSLNKLEKAIAKFMQNKQAIETLDLAFDTLLQNYPTQINLFRQIQRLCDSFNCMINLKGFQLIWKEGDRRQLSRDQFIECVSMNDYVVRLPKNFEEELKTKGFTRNQ